MGEYYRVIFVCGKLNISSVWEAVQELYLSKDVGTPHSIARKHLKEECKNETTVYMPVSMQLFQVSLRQGPPSVFGAKSVPH